MKDKIVFLLGLLLFLGIIEFDSKYLTETLFGNGTSNFNLIKWIKSFIHENILIEGAPNFDTKSVVRSSFIALSMALMAIPLVKNISKREGPLFVKNQFATYSIIVISGLVLIHMFKLIFFPTVFSELSREDGIVENGSALFLFLAAAILVFALVKLQCINKGCYLVKIFLALLAFGFFFVGMEEVSWFQRVIDFETPASFSNNGQGEFNFHNFRTNPIENVYYFSVFVGLVFLPLLFMAKPKFKSIIQGLPLILPSSFLLPIAALCSAYTFDMWNVVYMQAAFFGSIIILLLLTFVASNKEDKIMLLLTSLVLASAQITFIAFGDNYERSWEITEYRELMIPLAFLCYAIDTYLKIDRSKKVVQLDPVIGVS